MSRRPDPSKADLDGAVLDLRRVLGEYLDPHRTSGIVEGAVSGPGSLPELRDLEPPDLLLELLPTPLTQAQRSGLLALGYQPTADPLRLIHPSGWTLRLSEPEALDLPELQVLTLYLAHQQLGRTGADALLMPNALRFAFRRERFKAVAAVSALLAPLTMPWMVSSGWALDLFLGRRLRLHQDLDVVLPFAAQPDSYALLAPNWRLDASVNGVYQPWRGQPFGGFQVHARRQGWPMLDLMFSELDTQAWTYRRDPSLKLPLVQARRFSPQGWPYLAPELVLLFKAGRPGSVPRVKDEQDFRRVAPRLSSETRAFLAQTLRGSHTQHPWLKLLR